MSTSELKRVGVMERVAAGTLKLGAAARLLDVSYRQAKRIYRRYRLEGGKGLTHRSAGRQSNRAMAPEIRERALALVREKYSGEIDERFGPTLAAEHLASEDTIVVDHETLRRWMLAEGLWSRARKLVRIGGAVNGGRTSGSWCSSMAVSIAGLRSAATRAVC